MIAHDLHSMFKPPRPKSWRRRQAIRLAGAVVAALGLVTGGIAARQALFPAQPCAACVSANGTLPLNPQLMAVEKLIGTENAKIIAESGRNFVSIGLLLPLTYDSHGSVSLQRLTDALEAAYVAQLVINQNGSGVQVQLLLADEGNTVDPVPEANAVLAARQLEYLQGADHLVAVTGMGISVTQTLNAAHELAPHGIPMFTAATTADELHFSGLYQVVPDVLNQVSRLAKISPVPTGQKAVVVYDQADEDLYTSDLSRDFSTVYRSSIDAPQQGFSSATHSGLKTIADVTCYTPGTPPAILFAGRANALADLITYLKQAQDCGGKAITILTGADADGLDPRTTDASPSKCSVSVIYSDTFNMTGSLDPTYMSTYASAFRGTSMASSTNPDDQWGAAAYNAIQAAGDAIALAAPQAQGTIPTVTSVAGAASTSLLGPNAPQGATGTFSFDEKDGTLYTPNSPIPVFKDSGGGRNLLLPSGR